MLDMLCLTGDAGLGAPVERDRRRSSAPRRSRCICAQSRPHVGRTLSGPPGGLNPGGGVARRTIEPSEGFGLAAGAVLEYLRARGASFATELESACGLTGEVVRTALDRSGRGRGDQLRRLRRPALHHRDGVHAAVWMYGDAGNGDRPLVRGERRGTPAVSDGAIAVVLLPTKSMAMTPAAVDGVLTVTPTGAAACTSVPLVPVTVVGKLPAGADAGTATVIVATPDPVRYAGLNVTDVPAGWPEARRLTRPVKPRTGATVTEKVALPPGAIVHAGRRSAPRAGQETRGAHRHAPQLVASARAALGGPPVVVPAAAVSTPARIVDQFVDDLRDLPGPEVRRAGKVVDARTAGRSRARAAGPGGVLGGGRGVARRAEGQAGRVIPFAVDGAGVLIGLGLARLRRCRLGWGRGGGDVLDRGRPRPQAHAELGGRLRGGHEAATQDRRRADRRVRRAVPAPGGAGVDSAESTGARSTGGGHPGLRAGLRRAVRPVHAGAVQRHLLVRAAESRRPHQPGGRRPAVPALRRRGGAGRGGGRHRGRRLVSRSVSPGR